MSDGGKLLHAAIGKGLGPTLAIALVLVAPVVVSLLFGGEAAAQESSGVTDVSPPVSGETEQPSAPISEASPEPALAAGLPPQAPPVAEPATAEPVAQPAPEPVMPPEAPSVAEPVYQEPIFAPPPTTQPPPDSAPLPGPAPSPELYPVPEASPVAEPAMPPEEAPPLAPPLAEPFTAEPVPSDPLPATGVSPENMPAGLEPIVAEPAPLADEALETAPVPAPQLSFAAEPVPEPVSRAEPVAVPSPAAPASGAETEPAPGPIATVTEPISPAPEEVSPTLLEPALAQPAAVPVPAEQVDAFAKESLPVPVAAAEPAADTTASPQASEAPGRDEDPALELLPASGFEGGTVGTGAESVVTIRTGVPTLDGREESAVGAFSEAAVERVRTATALLGSFAGEVVAFLTGRVDGVKTGLVQAVDVLFGEGRGTGSPKEPPISSPPLAPLPPPIPLAAHHANALVNASSDDGHSIPLGVLESLLLLLCGCKLAPRAARELLRPESVLTPATERPG